MSAVLPYTYGMQHTENLTMTTLTLKDADAKERLRARMLVGHLKLHDVGMRHSRMSARQILDAATELTGITYKRGQYGLAVEHLDTIYPKIEKAE